MFARAALSLAFLGATLPACLTPPAVMQGVLIDAELAIELYPPGTERVEVTKADGATLRGLFVPAGDGAPVVLHLAESSGSVASLKYHYEVLCRQLADLGIASLLVDYTGVGASDGSPSPKHLAADARAMWREAVARAGGDPRRVALRGISLGTLAVAALLEEGARPSAVLLHCPILADTAVERFARTSRGALATWLAGLAYADVADVDLEERLARCEAPLLVFAGARDFFLTDGERARLAATVRSAGGVWVASARGHAESTILAHALLPEELELLAALFPPAPPGERELAQLLATLDTDVARRFDGKDARSRLAALAALARTTDPTLLAAVALANEPGLDTLRYLWIVREHGPARELPFDELLAAVALDDEPDGRLPVDAIADAALVGDLHDRFGGASVSENPWLMVGRVRRALGGQSAPVACGVDVGWDRAEVVSDAADVVAALRAAGFGEDALERAAVRVLLKGGRIPERIRRAPDDRVRLETLEDGAWQELDLGAEPGKRVFSGSFGRALGRRAQALVDAREAADG